MYTRVHMNICAHLLAITREIENLNARGREKIEFVCLLMSRG